MNSSACLAFLIASELALALSTSAFALDWPTRQVTVVVPIAAGGNTDMMARIAAERLSAKFGQPFVVENRSSAGGAVGTAQVAASKPDGYTLLFSASSMVLLTPLLQKVSFDPDQLVPITNIGTGAQVIGIRRSLPVTNLSEFIAYVKARPGALNCAVVIQTLSHLMPALLLARAQAEMVFIPAKGGPQAVADLMSGQVDMYFGTASELLPHIDSDQVRLIAVGTAGRLAAAPELPTVAESIPGFVFSSWNGLFAPAGTPSEIVEAVRAEISDATKSQDVNARLTRLGIVPGGLSRAEVAATFISDKATFADAVQAAGLKGPQP